MVTTCFSSRRSCKTRKAPRQLVPKKARPFVEQLESRLTPSVSVGEGNGVSQTDFGSIVPIVNETGLISLSVDGLGTNNAGGGTIQVEKAAGATVHKAFLAAASAGFTRRKLNNGDVKIDGAGVNWAISTPSSIFSWNHWADVTSMVKSKIDAAAAGRVNFTITEVGTTSIDGEILAVIFNDPNQTTNNTVALLFGAQNINGDTFNVGLAEPINKSDPNLKLDMSLGISFGFQGPSQFSIVNVNGTRLSSSAGGQDDGVAANGALLTVGGLDDSNANPANPFGGPANNPRTDDELYNLLPFVNNGASSISVFTQNPSRDDNIFFAAFNLKATTAVVGEGVLLSPTEATHDVGQTHTATATLQNTNGQPIVGRTVTFEVASGPQSGVTGTAVTGNDGKATFIYTGLAQGNDQLRARFVNNQNQTVLSNTTLIHWLQTNRPPSAGAGGPYDVDEGGAVQLDGMGMDLDGDVLTYTWDLDNNGSFETSGQTPSFSAAGRDGPSSQAIVLKVTDSKGASATSSGVVNILNVDPTATINGAPASSPEGTAISLTSSVTDPGPDTFTYAWGVTKNGNAYASGTATSFTFTPNDNGSYVVSLTVTDDDGGIGADSETITVNNVVPQNVNAGADQTVNEGALVSLSGSFTDPGTADTHTQTWSVAASNGQVIPNGSSASFSFTPNDNGVYTVTYTVTDDDGGVGSDTAVITVNNVAPTITTFAGPTGGVPGQTLEYSAAFTDPGSADTHTTTWEVLSGTTVVASGSGLSFSFTPTSTGAYTVKFTVTDDDSGQDVESLTLTVQTVALLADPCDSTKTALFVGGTTSNDLIHIANGAAAGQLTVTLNGVSQGTFAPTGHFIVFGQAGDDNIQVNGSVSQSGWLYGNAGNDRIKGGDGHDVLIGGDGDDLLVGGGGRDLIIGGTGADRIVGNAGDDIMIAGTTSYDAYTQANAAALCAIMDEWTSSRDFAARRANIAGTGTGARANGNYFLTTSGANKTVFDDSSVDVLTGSSAEEYDWFFYNSTTDRATDLNDAAFADDLAFING